MKRFRLNRLSAIPSTIALVFMMSLGASTASVQENVYDKFRDRTYSNDKLGISEQDEIKLGNEVHQQLLNPPKQEGQQQQQEQQQPLRLIQGTALDAYVNQLGQKLARDSKRPNIPWRFYVVDDKSVNAFATLGGHVYVHTGLIAQVQTESQLVSVIGHEIGHIVGRHGLENVKRAGSLKTQGAVVLGTILGAVLGGEAGAQAGNAVGSMVAGGYLMKHGRDAEREADYLGLYNMQRSGYNTVGMTEMFGILAELSQGGGGKLGSIMASHPPATERLANTQREIEQRLPGSTQRGVQTTNDFQRVKSSLPALAGTGTSNTTNTSSGNRNTRPRDASTSTGRPRRPRP